MFQVEGVFGAQGQDTLRCSIWESTRGACVKRSSVAFIHGLGMLVRISNLVLVFIYPLSDYSPSIWPNLGHATFEF